MKKLLIILACLSLIFMASNNLIASGGGGGGGGNGDNNHTGPSLFPSKPQEKQETEGAKQDPKESTGPHKQPVYYLGPGVRTEGGNTAGKLASGEFCFIDTASSSNWPDELLNFVWKPKSE